MVSTNFSGIRRMHGVRDFEIELNENKSVHEISIKLERNVP